MTAIFHYSMQLSMIVFAPHIGAELDWLQLTNTYYKGIFDIVVDTNVHRVFVDAEMAPIPRGKGGARYPERDGLTNVSGAANQLRAELTQQLHDAGVSQEEAWEAQLLLNMLGHRAWKHKLGQHFTKVLFE